MALRLIRGSGRGGRDDGGFKLRCSKCKTYTIPRKSTRDKPYFDSVIGIPNVGLIGTRIYYCPQCCRDVFYTIPSLSSLLRMMACVVAKKPRRLTGEEFKFLRTNLGINRSLFVKMVFISEWSLEAIESRSQRMNELPAGTDWSLRELLLRLLVLAIDNDTTKCGHIHRSENLVREFIDRTGDYPDTLLFEWSEKTGWCFIKDSAKK